MMDFVKKVANLVRLIVDNNPVVRNCKEKSIIKAWKKMGVLSHHHIVLKNKL